LGYIFEVTLLRERFLEDKIDQINISEARDLAEKWEHAETVNFLSAIRPQSYRQGKKTFDDCVQMGKTIIFCLSKREISTLKLYFSE